MALETQTAPPKVRLDPVRWMRDNLFSSWANSILTIGALALAYSILQPTLVWVFTKADWTVVIANLKLLMVGQYPLDQVWRVWLSLLLTMAMLGVSKGVWSKVVGNVGPAYVIGLTLLAVLPFPLYGLTNRLWLAACAAVLIGGWWLGRRYGSSPTFRSGVSWAWVLLLPLVLLLLRGIEPLLPVIPTRAWGGLLLTFVLAITTIVFSFPIGVLLAVGRRSSLPAVSIFSTIYIEVFRGVPLVTVLFMFLIMLPLFVPGSESTDNIIRAIVGFTLFTAAYIAENVRGGLQSIPKGQFEAAKAVGLNPFLTMVLIILPQALRIVIPSNVSQYVSLYKDTALVVVAGGGMLELLGISRNIANQPEFLGKFIEALVFAGGLYWIFAFSMSYIARRLEAEMGVSKR
jgi:general L-amino acid transport system permease protein